MPMTPPIRAPEAIAPARGRRTLLLIAALFLLPILLGIALWLGGWRPEGRSLEYGELLAPARPVGDARLEGVDNAATGFAQFGGHWVFMSFVRLPCTAACRDNLYKMQQVWLAQGREARRVQRVVVLLARTAPAERAALAAAYPGLTVLQGEDAVVRDFARGFVTRDGSALDGLDRVYLVDPHGNLVLSYAPQADASGMRKDLARLLRMSKIG
jgi:hypothetical protein